MKFVNKLNAIQKLFLSLFVSVILFFVTKNLLPDITVRCINCWDIFCFLFLSLNWITFWTVKPRQIREEASIQNVNKIAVFIIAIVTTFCAMILVLQMLLDKSVSHQGMSYTLFSAIAGLLLSWILVHTVFTLRYAHLFYANHEDDKSKHAGGLDFPNETHPDFLDFAYYSFVIGMTFQVSDVTVTSKDLRRLTLMHSLLAFAFNTIIVALTVNVIAGLSK